MKKSKWVAVVFAAVFLILVLAFFLYRDSFVSEERVVTKEKPEAVSNCFKGRYKARRGKCQKENNTSRSEEKSTCVVRYR